MYTRTMLKEFYTFSLAVLNIAWALLIFFVMFATVFGVCTQTDICVQSENAITHP